MNELVFSGHLYTRNGGENLAAIETVSNAFLSYHLKKKKRDPPPLKHHHRISQEITDVQLPTILDDISVFPDKKPANVGKEESPLGIVGISIRLRVLVMYPVIPRPFENVILFITVREKKILVTTSSSLLSENGTYRTYSNRKLDRKLNYKRSVSHSWIKAKIWRLKESFDEDAS